jgi:hypothetical protein
MLKYFLVFVVLFNITLDTKGQKLKRISDYTIGVDEEINREVFKISGELFYDDWKTNTLYLNGVVLDSITMDSSYSLEVYKDRYLFIAFKKYERFANSAGELHFARKYKVRVYDLKNREKRWNFYFAGYNSMDLRWFKPRKSKIKFVSKYLTNADK